MNELRIYKELMGKKDDLYNVLTWEELNEFLDWLDNFKKENPEINNGKNNE